MNFKNGWLYGLIIFLAQTCNPYYQASNQVYIPDNAFSMEEKIEMPPRMEEAPPPPPPPVQEERAEIFKVVEDMPRFAGCEGRGLAKRELKSCGEEKMLKYIYSNLEYPKVAKENGIEGRVILQFVVNEDGSISDTRVVRDISGGCGAAAVRVVNSMPKWIPGKQRGRPVKVQYTLPVSFRLDVEDTIEEVAPVFEDQSIEEEPEIEVAVEEEPEELIFKVVEDMPRFPGCENTGLGKDELRKCADKKMLGYIYSNLKYPQEARANGVEGRAILQFVVNKDGLISNARVLRAPGGGCGEEAVRVVNSMPRWIPGKQRGKAVKVQYTLPVMFKL